MKKYILIFICAAVSFAALPKTQEIMRVCVLKDAQDLKLTVDSGYKIYSIKTGEIIKRGKSLYKVKISAIAEGILLGNTLLPEDAVKLISDKDGRIYIDKKRFRGEVVIFKTPELKLVVVNNIGIEDYLYGVLYHEISHRWPNEVIKAQAIAARTYALYQKRLMQGKPYDLTADIYSQVYGG
ncbi:MAG: hypothetical protein NTV07_00640, partial [Candidatus Omnitrophica bacterium]|nr:hypothetical protein [Candidatus Omnitrophota bacterium]